MLPTIVWFDLAVGVLCVATAYYIWVRGRRWSSGARRWISISFIAFGLCAWFTGAAILAGPSAAGPWYLMVIAAILLAVCSGSIGALREVRERQNNSRDQT